MKSVISIERPHLFAGKDFNCQNKVGGGGEQQQKLKCKYPHHDSN